MKGLELGFKLEYQSAEFGAIYAAGIKAFSGKILAGVAREATRRIKAGAPKRKRPKDYKLADGSLNKQTDTYGKLKTSFFVKGLPKAAKRGGYLAKFVISRNQAYWINFLLYGKSISRTDRGTLKPIKNFIDPVIFSLETGLLNQVHASNIKAISLAAKNTKVIKTEHGALYGKV